MKRKNKTVRIISALLLLAMLCTLLCSCLGAKNIIGTSINDKGELIVSYSDGTSENLGVIKGETGETGAPGMRGEAGKNGKDGADGEDGQDGATGEKGDPGSKGADGEDGRDGQITVVDDSYTISLAASRGLQSAVSIYCTFPAGTSAGSGVIWKLDEDGNALIITNHHVVYNSGTATNGGISEDIVVYLYGAEYTSLAIEAEYLGGSMYYDIAVLKVSESEFLKNSDAVAARVADSEQVCVGDQAVAVGNPKGAGLSASFGIVSVDTELITMLVGNTQYVSMRVMRIDTAVNSGNSGGGLYNAAGELCGIVNAKVVSEDVENMGYAIPSNLAIAVAQNIVDHCDGVNALRVKRANLGIEVRLMDSYAELDPTDNRMKIVQKVGVSDVDPDGIANEILQVGDEIVSVTLGDRTVTVTRLHHVTDLLLDVRAGDTLTFTILRDGTPMTRSITVDATNLVEY